MGKYDSSLTRVQPVFNALYEKDPIGKSWVSALLHLGSRSKQATIPEIIPLRQPPVFEFSADPPKSFLKYLINNPSKLSSPTSSYWNQCSVNTREKRKALLAGDVPTQTEAIQKIDGVKKLQSKVWWRLEGVTQVDCALIAENTVIFIEGKRTERGASKNIIWYQHRNQVLRNLDCAAEYADQNGLQNYFVMLVVEKRLTENDPVRKGEIKQVLLPETIESSLPHLTANQRKEIMTHYLGWTTWEDIVAELGLDSGVLIDRVGEK